MGARLFSAAAGAALVALLAACSAGSEPAATSPATSTYPTLGPLDVVSEDPDMLVDPDAGELVPAWTPEVRAAVITTATEAFTAWARPDLPYEQWWAGLAAFLTPGAQEVVALTDPANIPVRAIGAVDLPDEGDTAYVGWVSVETDAGTWWVLVAFQDDGTWLVDRITQSHEVTP